MTILTRHLIRAHAGPFLFAFTAVTGLLFLNAVAQRLEALAGRGLGLSVFGEFMLLSLPHVVALTFPMSILVAVLYALTDMTGHNEVAAISSGGIHPLRLILPLIAVGLLFSGLMFYFNDRVLPESNHRLNSLMADIGSKSPTFELREEVVNEIHTGDDTRYYLRARSIDREANRLEEVTIFDLTDPGALRTIVAEAGTMAFTPDLRDLILTLTNGVIYGVSDDRPGSFQWLGFETQILPFRGVGQELERRDGGTRGDREMSTAMLGEEVDRSLAELDRISESSRILSMDAVEQALGNPAMGASAPTEEIDLSVAIGPDWMDELRRSGIDVREDQVIREVTRAHRTNAVRFEVHRVDALGKQVEIHKKYSIALACLVFVLLGFPLAIRFPQGGLGMVIAASVGIFFFYWVGLIGGERLAERGYMNPALAMWAPSGFLLVPALLLMSRTSRQISTNRGSAWDEFRFRIREAFRWGGRSKARPRAAAEGSAR